MTAITSSGTRTMKVYVDAWHRGMRRWLWGRIWEDCVSIAAVIGPGAGQCIVVRHVSVRVLDEYYESTAFHHCSPFALSYLILLMTNVNRLKLLMTKKLE